MYRSVKYVGERGRKNEKQYETRDIRSNVQKCFSSMFKNCVGSTENGLGISGRMKVLF